MNKRPIWAKLTILVIAGAVVAVAAPLFASGHPVEGPTILGIPTAKWMDLLWRTLNFAALVVILVKFGAKPIGNILKTRQSTIRDQFDDLESRKNEAESSYRELEDKLGAIDKEINAILETAKTQGEAEKERIIEEANRAAGDIKRQAEMAVQHELAEAKLLLRKEVANQAVIMAEELIKKNLQADDQVKLVEDYLEKVGAIQ